MRASATSYDTLQCPSSVESRPRHPVYSSTCALNYTYISKILATRQGPQMLDFSGALSGNLQVGARMSIAGTVIKIRRTPGHTSNYLEYLAYQEFCFCFVGGVISLPHLGTASTEWPAVLGLTSRGPPRPSLDWRRAWPRSSTQPL